MPPRDTCDTSPAGPWLPRTAAGPWSRWPRRRAARGSSCTSPCRGGDTPSQTRTGTCRGSQSPSCTQHYDIILYTRYTHCVVQTDSCSVSQAVVISSLQTSICSVLQTSSYVTSYTVRHLSSCTTWHSSSGTCLHFSRDTSSHSWTADVGINLFRRKGGRFIITKAIIIIIMGYIFATMISQNKSDKTKGHVSRWYRHINNHNDSTVFSKYLFVNDFSQLFHQKIHSHWIQCLSFS